MPGKVGGSGENPAAHHLQSAGPEEVSVRPHSQEERATGMNGFDGYQYHEIDATVLQASPH